MGEVFDFESGSLADTEFRKAIEMQPMQFCIFWQEGTLMNHKVWQTKSPEMKLIQCCIFGKKTL